MTEEKDRFARAVWEQRGALYRAALAILSSPADAEDAVSAAVEAAWKHLPGLRNPDALPAYLLRCTVNSARA
ncbi:MAG: sigma factor, partial [Eubacteriales bacterium]|nr:sigma factor [Eubacteriales bacterium]